MQVSVIIINYNTFQLTCDCIRSLLAMTGKIPFEVILVDNASSETDAQRFLDEFPGIRLVKNERNSGFADGNNLGISHARGEYILLLNSDTVFTEDSISACLSKLEEAPGIGILGCRMIYPGGRVQYTARRFRSLSWELLDLFRFIPYLLPYRRRAPLMLGRYFRHDEDCYCDWVNGAFFLFRREILPLLPGKKLDDRFFMYGEDQLWCEQVKKMGYDIFFHAGTTIMHINGGSTDISKQLRLRKTMIKHELEIMRIRKGRGLYYVVFTVIFAGKEWVRNLVKALVFKISGKLIR